MALYRVCWGRNLSAAALQEAHVMQTRFVRKLESEATQSKQTVDTVKSQEGVIAKLESLLRQAAAERRAAVADAEKLQQQLAGLESQLESSQSQASKAATAADMKPSLRHNVTDSYSHVMLHTLVLTVKVAL